MISSEIIHVVTAANEAYLPHAATMLSSLIRADQQQHYCIHFIHDQALSSAGLQRLRATVEALGQTFHNVPAPRTLISEFPQNELFPREALYRLRLNELLTDIPKLLWLDSDIVIKDSIMPLWQTHMRGHAVAAVANHNGRADHQHVCQLGLPPDSYFNSGVLLMDMQQLQTRLSLATLQAIMARHRHHIHYPDQDILNVALQDHWLALPPKWNFMTAMLVHPLENYRRYGYRRFQQARKHPAVIHYCGSSVKPWLHKSPHPDCDLYWYHRQLANWGGPEFTDQTLFTTVAKPLPYMTRHLIAMLRNTAWQGVWDTVFWRSGNH